MDPEVVQSLLLDRDVEGRASHGGLVSVALYAPAISTEKKGEWCCERLDDLRHKHHILHELPCFYAVQETDNWTTSAMNVRGHIVYGTGHGRTVILYPREVRHFRRSWVDNDRCTAFLVGP